MATRASTVAAVFIALGLVWSCSPDDSAGTVRDTAGAVATVAPELPTATTLAGAPRTPLSSLETARLTLDSPDWLTSAGGDLWVRLDGGDVVRVDPDRAETVATVPPMGNSQFAACQGLGAGAAVWACGKAYVQRIDPRTSEVTEHFELEVSRSQGTIATADGKAWFLSGDGSSFLTVSEDTNEVSEPAPLGATCNDLASDGSTVWASCAADNAVLAIDAASGAVTRALTVDEPRRVAVGDYLWVSSAVGVVQVEPDDLSVKAVFDVGDVSTADVSESGDAAWVRTGGGPFLVEIDPEQGTVVAVVTSGDLASGGNSLMIDGQLWATAYDDATLVRLTPPPGK